MSEKSTYGAVVVNDHGHILLHTVKNCISACEEYCIEFWGEELWAKLQKLGCKIVECKLSIHE